MTQKDNKEALILTSSPHIRRPETTTKIMWTVTICLIPSGCVSIYVFGLSVLWIILTAVFSTMAVEWLFCFIQKKKCTLNDGSAVLTGLLLSYNLPPQSPLWMVITGSTVAIVFGKWFLEDWDLMYLIRR